MQRMVVFVALYCCSESKLRHPLRVHLGQEDVNNEFPFAVSLQDYRGGRVCTGSLIARDWVLTAAHCFGDDKYVIRYTNFTEKAKHAKFARVRRLILHPGYVDHFQGSKNDIALVKITKVSNKTIGKLSAIDHNTLIGLPVKYAGFGVTGEDDEWLEGDDYRPLQVGEAVVVPWDDDSQGPNIISIAPKCSNREHGIRGGDSGGPLIYDGKIIGVASASFHGNNIADYPAVSAYLQWIRRQMIIYGYKL